MSATEQLPTLGPIARYEQSVVDRIKDFDDPRQEWRRLFSELLGTFLLVMVAAGGGMMGQAFPGAIGRSAAVVAMLTWPAPPKIGYLHVDTTPGVCRLASFTPSDNLTPNVCSISAFGTTAQASAPCPGGLACPAASAAPSRSRAHTVR